MGSILVNNLYSHYIIMMEKLIINKLLNLFDISMLSNFLKKFI